jgi:hypothetical protein
MQRYWELLYCALIGVEGSRMWDEVKQVRFNALRTAERQGVLTEVEGA